MELIQATKTNGIFRDLEAQWAGQLAKYDESLDDYVTSFRDHCKTVIEADHKNYFVYALNNGGAHEAFVHINHARIKRLSGLTLRVLEIYLAPNHDFEDIKEDTMNNICSSLFTSLVKISENELKADNIKIHMGPLDRKYLAAFAKFFSDSKGLTIEVQGSWLLVTKSS
jgi:hypothetical protein